MTVEPFSILVSTEKEMLDLGYQMGTFCLPGEMLYLEGDLGAGKTTFARGFLRGLGYSGFVKSPTYSLIEVYDFESGTSVVHMDLYRIAQEAELYDLGLTDYLNKNAIFLIEWPEKAKAALPKATLQCQFEKEEPEGRRVTFTAFSVETAQWLEQVVLSLRTK